jgi:hypothetical protein
VLTVLSFKAWHVTGFGLPLGAVEIATNFESRPTNIYIVYNFTETLEF